MIPITGYVSVIDTVMGGSSLWTVQIEGEEVMPEIWATEKEAQKEIIANYIEHLEQFMDDEREYEDTNTLGPDEYVGAIKIYEDGEMIVWDGEGTPIIETTLEKWRANI
jgi:hypothetical protein